MMMMMMILMNKMTMRMTMRAGNDHGRRRRTLVRMTIMFLKTMRMMKRGGW